MRFCLVSDTHRHRHELLTAVKHVLPCAAVLHAGDETADAAWLAERIDTPIFAVAGNWDEATSVYPLQRVVAAAVPILLTHGHRLRVKEGVRQLAELAIQAGAQVVVYGHTHVADVRVHNDVLLVNPGSLAEPRGRMERTYAVLELTEHPQDATRLTATVQHFQANGQFLPDLAFSKELQKTANWP